MENFKVLYLILNGTPYGGSEKHVVDVFNKVSESNIDAKLVYSKGNALIERINNTSNTLPLGRGLADFFRLLSIIYNEKPHILHAHAARALIFARFAKLILSVTRLHSFKLISTSHGLWIPPLKNKLQLHRLMHLLKTQDDLTLAVSDFSRRELIEKGYHAKKVKFIYNGIDFSHFDSVRIVKEHVRNVVFVGRLTEQKGISDLMDLVYRENETKSEVSFEIYGSGHLENYIKDYISKKNLKNVTVRGHTDNVSEVFYKADVLVAPSLNEGLPYTLVEAANCGIPILSTKVGGVPEIVYDGVNGYLAEPSDIDDLYSKFQKIKLSDIKSLSSESINVSQKFSLTIMVETILNEYRDCLK